MSRTNVFILIVSIIVAAIIFLISAPFCDQGRSDYIAHAGGSIDGFVYTNSLEAVERSIREGYTYIELDLQLTADNVPVAVHDWVSYREMVDVADTSFIPTLKQFREKRLYERYTPISYMEIDSIWRSNSNLILVTDKLDDAEILNEFFHDLKNRMIVECFSEKALGELNDSGFKTMYNYHRPINSLKMAVFGLFGRKNADMLTIRTDCYDCKFKILNRIINRPVALYFVRDSSEAQYYIDTNECVRFVYTDNISM